MTGERERAALAALRLSWVQGPDDVWRPSLFHVEGLHRQTMRMLRDGLAEAAASRDTSPIGVVVQGQKGAGKTHLLGWLREEVQGQEGYFFLVGLLDARNFWESTVVSLLEGLARETVDGWSQLQVFLWRLAVQVGAEQTLQHALLGKTPLTREDLDDFIVRLRRTDPQVGRMAQNTARALVLLASDDLGLQDIAESYLHSLPEEEPGERAAWGIRRGDRTPQEIVRDISRLLALTGPSVIAVDQIDALIAQSAMATDAAVGGELDWDTKLMIEHVAGGLMALREVTRRTLTVVSCIPPTWVHIEKNATDTVLDRFRAATPLQTIPDAETGRELIAKRFAARFRVCGFTPPYPTWPVRPSAFEDAPDLTPRQLLIKVDAHIRHCLDTNQIIELDRLVTGPESRQSPPVATPSAVVAPPAAVDLGALDDRFAALKAIQKVEAALDPATEDAEMPPLLAAGLTAWIAGLGEAGRDFSQDPAPSAKPPLHARLRRTLDETTEDEIHWAFRAIASPNAIAALSRLRNAAVAAGLDERVPKRRLFVLRNHPWSPGERTLEAVRALEAAGGRVLRVEMEDLRILGALRDLIAENPPDLQAWLAARRPAEAVTFLREALVADPWAAPGEEAAHSAPASGDAESTRGDAGATGPSSAPGHARTGGRHARSDAVNPDIGRLEHPPAQEDSRGGHRYVQDAPPGGQPYTGKPSGGQLYASEPLGGQRYAGEPPHARADAGPSITVGTAMGDGRPIRVSLAALRRHTAIFAGTGSGKTVLIRGVIERCALHGVSAIVLDPNNDLARLGDRWPQAPANWGPGDAALAEEYLAHTDVVIWTPGRDAGRPLSFQPLPDFASVLGDADEFKEAVEIATASLVPRAKLDKETQRAHLGRAVLREALTYYGRRGGSGLSGLITLLADLPDGVSQIRDAAKIAADLARTLTAETVIDPMFGGAGTPVDPGVLLTPPPGRRARISVISFVGLPSDAQRQSFVNQLQMALFAWIKKNPAADRPLGGLFVMDEAQNFAPSGALTPCTRSTLALAAQARKYGLGLIFATQAPKGLHNQIPGNAATQFFGLLNSPAQIDAAKEVARYKGGDVSEIARLGKGEFYVAVEGGSFTRTRTPMCLTHHPADPLTTEEVIERASRTR